MGSPDGGLGDSKTTLLRTGPGGDRFEAWSLRWSDWASLAHPGPVDFVKMDIEGGEFEVLPTMREYLVSEKPTLLLSLHAPLLVESERGPRLEEVLDVLSGYEKCFDESRRPVQMQTVAAEARDQYRSYLFMGP